MIWFFYSSLIQLFEKAITEIEFFEEQDVC